MKLGNSGAFAHQNRFSILASDDDENSLSDCDVAEHATKFKNQTWKLRGERDDEFSCCEERVDAGLDPRLKVTCQRKVNAFQSNTHHVSYLAKSEVDSKGVHHVAGSGMEKG